MMDATKNCGILRVSIQSAAMQDAVTYPEEPRDVEQMDGVADDYLGVDCTDQTRHGRRHRAEDRKYSAPVLQKK